MADLAGRIATVVLADIVAMSVNAGFSFRRNFCQALICLGGDASVINRALNIEAYLLRSAGCNAERLGDVGQFSAIAAHPAGGFMP